MRVKLPKKWALSKELAIVLTVKVLLILLIWRLFFYHPVIDTLNNQSVKAHFYGAPLVQPHTTSKPAK